MDLSKCAALKEQLAQEPDPQLVSIEEFFDGNDDLGSIGCNLCEHPGLDAFREVLSSLANRNDVRSVRVMISESDPGGDCWPFSDMVLVSGDISAADLRQFVRDLEPSEVAPAEEFGIPSKVREIRGEPLLAIWWD